MIQFSQQKIDDSESRWKHQLDRFVKNHRQELAALAWGLHLEKKPEDVIGIDLKEPAHFIYCPQVAIQQFNENVEGHIQEILGHIRGHKPTQEVLMIAIGNHQLKLIFFEPAPPPPTCFAELGESVDALLSRLEKALQSEVKL